MQNKRVLMVVGGLLSLAALCCIGIVIFGYVYDGFSKSGGSAGETQKESRFSLPSDTESAIVTKIGETLGFWVAGDDITYDTFGACAEVSILLMRIDHLACLHHRLYPAASRLRVQLLTAQY